MPIWMYRGAGKSEENSVSASLALDLCGNSWPASVRITGFGDSEPSALLSLRGKILDIVEGLAQVDFDDLKWVDHSSLPPEPDGV